MKQFLFALAFSGLLAAPAVGQSGAPATGINATMLKMFGDTKTFTAQANARLLDGNQKEISAIPMTMSMRDNKLRTEMDMSQVKGGSIPPEAAGMLKQVGMDRMVTLVRPDKKATIMLYPGLQSYAEVPFTEEEASEAKVESTALGTETIDGHPCRKTKLTSSDAKGGKQEAIVWQATDLKNFPIQMQMAQRGNTLLVKFQSPKLEAPDASLFEVPTGYTKYPSLQALMQAAMMKMLGGPEQK
jgi:hypothetical protein